MPTFKLTSPQGQTYEVTGPEGATEQDALRMLQRQLAGMPPAPPKIEAPASPGIGAQVGDFFKSIPRGILGGLAGTASAGGQAAQIEMGQPVDVPGAEETTGLLEKHVTGALPKPGGTAGQFGETIGEFIGSPASYLGPGGLARKAGSAVVSALGSETAGQLTKGTKAEPFARAAGAILAPVVGGRAITPVRAINPERAAAVNLLRQEGVDAITAGQATGNKRLRFAESELGGSTAERLVERQGEQFTSAALRRAGEDAVRATPEVIDRAFTRIGAQMNRLAAANNLIADQRLVNDLTHARQNYTNLVAPPMQAPVVQHVLERVINSMNAQGIVPGRVYQTIRSDIGRYARSASKDPTLQHTLYEIQAALDGNVERVMGQNNPNMVGAWRDARRQYRNLLTIERAASYGGEAANSGIISPSSLNRATKAIEGLRSYSRARGEFRPLARAGAEILTPLPSSGTAQRLRAHSIPALISAAIGGTAGSGAGPLGVAGGIAAGVVAPRLMGEAALSAPGRRYLGNQLLPPDQSPALSAAKKGIASQQHDYGGPQ